MLESHRTRRKELSRLRATKAGSTRTGPRIRRAPSPSKRQRRTNRARVSRRSVQAYIRPVS